MKPLPGPLFIPSLGLSALALATDVASSNNSTLIVVAGIGAFAAMFGAYLGYKGKKIGEAAHVLAIDTKKVADETKVIATETRSMTDGRMTDMAKQVNELTTKLATSENNNARLIAEEVGKASRDVIAKAQDVLAKAEDAADVVLKRAEERAAQVILDARRQAETPPAPPRRR